MDNPTIEEAMQYADGLPADCFADRCIINLAAEVRRLREENDRREAERERAHMARFKPSLKR